MALLVSGLILYVSIVEVFSMAIALILVVLALRGYRRSRSDSFLLAAIGFGMLGAASLVEGVLYQIAGFTLDEAHAFRSTLTAVGLVVLLYSIYRLRAPQRETESIRQGHTEPATNVAMALAGYPSRLGAQGLVQPLVHCQVQHVTHQPWHLPCKLLERTVELLVHQFRAPLA